jgi:hypothetical protein
MPHLADTNILLRWVQPHHPDYPVIQAALNMLRRRGDAIYITPQNLIEFWNSATRPVDRNGFGFTPSEADQEVTRLDRTSGDTPELWPSIRGRWRAQHDAAVCCGSGQALSHESEEKKRHHA